MSQFKPVRRRVIIESSDEEDATAVARCAQENSTKIPIAEKFLGVLGSSNKGDDRNEAKVYVSETDSENEVSMRSTERSIIDIFSDSDVSAVNESLRNVDNDMPSFSENGVPESLAKGRTFASVRMDHENASFKQMRRSLAAVVVDSSDEVEDGRDSETSQEAADSDDEADEKHHGSTKDDAVEQSDNAKRDSARLRSSDEQKGSLPPLHAQDSDTSEAFLSAHVSSPQNHSVASVSSSSSSTVNSDKKNDEAKSITDLQRQRDVLAADIRKLEVAAKMTNARLLPDGGESLAKKLSLKQTQLSDLERKLNQSNAISKHEQVTEESAIRNVSAATQTNVSNNLAASSSALSRHDLPSSSRDIKATKPTFSSVDLDPFKYSKPITTFYPPAAASKPQPPPNAIQMLPTSFFQDDRNNNLLSGRMNDARWREAQIVTHEAIERIHLSLKNCPNEEVETVQPEGLTTRLMDHQRQALTWLLWRESENPPGGILADDMGLGKTLTMISLVLCQKLAKKAGKRPDPIAQMRKARPDLVPSRTTLVVCPASVMGQWEQEIKTRVEGGNLKVLLYHGSNRYEEPSYLARHDVIITTYGIVRSEVLLEDEKGSEDITKTDDESDSDDYDKRGKKKTTSKKDKEKCLEPGPLSQLVYERIILDEAHLIKNHKSIGAKACCRLVAISRWAVTGTPIQNKLLEFYSLLKFLRCSPFDEYRVWKQWIEDNKSKRADQRLQALVKSLLLRRLKSDINPTTGKPIVDLPPKQIETYSLVLQSDERKVYDKFFKASQLYVKEFLKSQADKDRELIGISSGRSTHEQLGYRNPFKSNAQSGASFERKPQSTQILVMLLRLRQACCHLSLMKSAVDFDALKQDCGLESTVETQLAELDLNADEVEHVDGLKRMFLEQYASTKLAELLRLVKSIVNAENGGRQQKCVIVSQWVTLLNIVGDHLRKAGIHYTSITGEVEIQERNPRVERFNRVGGTQVMLLSLCAGGVGLNLVGGNHLVLLDLHWNPALEQQAADRIYRLGQKRNVFVHRLVCNDTIEGRILELQKQKLELVQNVLSGAGSKNLNKLTIADLKTLFLLDEPTKKAPRPVVKVASNSNIALAAASFPLPKPSIVGPPGFSKHTS